MTVPENTRIQRGLDDLVSLFNRTCNHLEAESLRHLVDAGNALFTRAMQTVLKDTRLVRPAFTIFSLFNPLMTA